jgi:hypothetical protein
VLVQVQGLNGLPGGQQAVKASADVHQGHQHNVSATRTHTHTHTPILSRPSRRQRSVMLLGPDTLLLMRSARLADGSNSAATARV